MCRHCRQKISRSRSRRSNRRRRRRHIEASVKQIVTRRLSARQLRRSRRRRKGAGGLSQHERGHRSARLTRVRSSADAARGGGSGDLRGARVGGGCTQRCDLQVHVQRRCLSCVPESMRPLPHRRRRRANVAPEVRGRVSLGRIAACRAAGRGDRRPPRFRQGRAPADLRARARHRARLGDGRDARRRQGTDA